MRKKLLAAVLSAVMTLTMVPMTASAETITFSDLNGHWAASIVQEAVSRGIVNGYSDYQGTYFKPDNLMTREEFFTMVTKVLSAQPDTTGVNISKFCDVVTTEWYAQTVAKAVAAGITNGTTTKEKDGYDSFGVGLMITRQEAAKIVSNIIDPSKQLTYDEMTAGQAKYKNINDSSKIASWAAEHVEKLFVRGYMQGATNADGTTSFNPTNALTRAEAATLMLNVVKGESKILGPNQSGATVTTPTTTSAAVTTSTAVTTSETAVTTVKGTIFTKSCGASIKAVKSEKVDGTSKGCKCDEDYSFSEGTGKKTDPYVIRTAAQLNHVREHLADEAYFILDNDIEIKEDYAKTVETRGLDWTKGNFEPLGNEKTPFEGHFDGNGYSVIGLKIEGSCDNGGLFGYLEVGSTIENLTIEESSIIGGQYAGAIAGYSEGTITYCTVDSDVKVSGTYNVGGIVGYTTSDVTNCENDSKVVGSRNAVGGIVGTVMSKEATIENCLNKGNIEGASNVGGIVGSLVGTKDAVKLTKCSNEGNIEATDSGAGGIAGEAAKGSYDAELTYCYNEGTVSGKGDNGGIAGSAGKYAKLSYNHNKGLVSGGGAGGIVGNNESDLKLCINAGEITGNNYAGGIAALQSGDEAKISQCYNSGTISCKNWAGGIVGDNSKRIYSCYNIGSISSDTYAGGIAGRNSSTLYACYSLGKTSGKAADGQIIGLNKGTVEGVFWAKDNGSDAVGQKDTVMSQGAARALTIDQLQGLEVFDATGLVKGKFFEVLNQYDKSGNWVQLTSNGYPSLANMFV